MELVKLMEWSGCAAEGPPAHNPPINQSAAEPELLHSIEFHSISLLNFLFIADCWLLEEMNYVL